jgi:hypothetical protein
MAARSPARIAPVAPWYNARVKPHHPLNLRAKLIAAALMELHRGGLDVARHRRPQLTAHRKRSCVASPASVRCRFDRDRRHAAAPRSMQSIPTRVSTFSQSNSSRNSRPRIFASRCKVSSVTPGIAAVELAVKVRAARVHHLRRPSHGWNEKGSNETQSEIAACNISLHKCSE